MGTPVYELVLRWLQSEVAERNNAALAIAQRAADAAEESVKVAKWSARLSVWAIGISLLAIVVTVAQVWIGWFVRN